MYSTTLWSTSIHILYIPVKIICFMAHFVQALLHQLILALYNSRSTGFPTGLYGMVGILLQHTRPEKGIYFSCMFGSGKCVMLFHNILLQCFIFKLAIQCCRLALVHFHLISVWMTKSIYLPSFLQHFDMARHMHFCGQPNFSLGK